MIGTLFNKLLPGKGVMGSDLMPRGPSALWRMGLGNVEDDSTGPAFYINNAGEIVTIPAGSPLYAFAKFWSMGSFTQYLANPTSPVNQTAGTLGTGNYTLWIRGTGSVAVSANTATITGAGSATEGTPFHFEVTVAGTVDIAITGDCDVFQLTDTVWSPEPFFANGLVTIANRAGTTSVPLTSGLKPYTLLDGANFKLKFDWTPSFSYSDLSANQGILNCRTENRILYYTPAGNLSFYDGTDVSFYNINYTALTQYEVELLVGNNLPSYPDVNKKQLKVRVKGETSWNASLTNFNGSFNPDTELVVGYNNDYPFNITPPIFTNCLPGDWE